MGTIKTTNIETITGSGTLTLGQSGETVTVPSGVTLSGGVTNTPAFLADNGTTRQTLADDTTTKIDFGTEIYDTDNAFASSKFTVPSGKAGKYFIYASVDIFNGGNDMTNFTFYLYKNGSAFTLHTFNGNGNANLRRNTLFFSYTLDLAAADYIEFYVEVEDSGSDSMDIRENNNATYFGGFKLIGV
jgi:hypothetical protein